MMETYSGEGGLAESAVVSHYYGGASSTPSRSKKSNCKGSKMACKKKSGTKPKK